MMISGRVGRFGQFRLWCDEPHPHVVDCKWLGLDGSGLDSIGDKNKTSELRNIVLEVMNPRGARSLYALLGLHYQSSGGSLKINVISHSSTCAIYKGSLIDGFEVAHIGLPAEYAEASVAGLKQGLANDVDANQGQIDICCAAYGNVSSSEPFFEKVGFALAHLLRLSYEDLTEDMVNSFFTN